MSEKITIPMVPCNQVPVGSLTLYAGDLGNADISPTGWMLCDGSILDIAKYPLLFQVLGERFGRTTTPEKTFRIPDYSGAPRPPKSTWLIRFM